MGKIATSFDEWLKATRAAIAVDEEARAAAAPSAEEKTHLARVEAGKKGAAVRSAHRIEAARARMGREAAERYKAVQAERAKRAEVAVKVEEAECQKQDDVLHMVRSDDFATLVAQVERLEADARSRHLLDPAGKKRIKKVEAAKRGENKAFFAGRFSVLIAEIKTDEAAKRSAAFRARMARKNGHKLAPATARAPAAQTSAAA